MLTLIRTPNMRKSSPNMRGKLADVHQICVNRYTKYAWKTAKMHCALWIGAIGDGAVSGSLNIWLIEVRSAGLQHDGRLEQGLAGFQFSSNIPTGSRTSIMAIISFI